MNDDFDKQPPDDDDNFDWLNDDDDSSDGEDSGITGQLSWLEENEQSPDAGKKRSQTDDLELDWMQSGMDGAPSDKAKSTGITGELSWLQDDMADSPDARRSGELPDWLQEEDEIEPAEANLAPEAHEDEQEDPTLYTGPRGLLSGFSSDADDDEDDAGTPSWLSNMGETGALHERDLTPDWLSNVGDTGMLSRQDFDREMDNAEEDDNGDPAWLTNMGLGTDSLVEEASELDTSEYEGDADFDYDDDYDEEAEAVPGEMPDWLQSMNVGAGTSQAEDDVTEDDEDDWMQYGNQTDSLADEDEEEDELFATSDTRFSTDFLASQADRFDADELPSTGELAPDWLEYDETEEEPFEEEEYDPYAQYSDEYEEDELEVFDEFDDLFGQEQEEEVNTDFLTTQGGVFDEDQPMSEPIQGESPDWLSAYADDDFAADDDSSGYDVFSGATEPTEDADPLNDVPDWLKGQPDADSAQPTPVDEYSDPLDDTPDWLKGPAQDDFASQPEMTADDLLSDLGLDEDFGDGDRVPTGFTGALGDLPDDLDFDLGLDDDSDEVERVSTGFTGELGDLPDDIDLDFLLDEIDTDGEGASTGFTGELGDLPDDIDLDFLLDEIDTDDVLAQEFDDADLDDLLDAESEEQAVPTSIDDLDFLDQDEDFGEFEEAEELDLEMFDQADEAEELDLDFLDEEDEGAPDWFEEEDVTVDEEYQPEWMQTIEDVEVADDQDLEDLFGELDMADDKDDMPAVAPQRTASNLDELLASFEEVDDDYVEPSASPTDLDAILNEALAVSDDDLPNAIPDWLRDVDVSDDETSAAAIIRRQTDRPIEELDDRLQALREKALSSTSDIEPAGETPSILSGMRETLAPPLIQHQIANIGTEIILTDMQRRQSALLQEIVGVTISQSSGISTEGIPVVHSSREQKRPLPNVGRGRLFISILLLVAVIVPFFVNMGIGNPPVAAFDGENNPYALALFNQVDALQEGQYVLVGFEYSPTGAGELDTVGDVLLRHIFAKGAKPIIVSSNPVAIVHAQNIINNIAESVESAGLTVQPNHDYYVVRYLAGGTLGLRDLSQNFDDVVMTDAKGQPTGLRLTSLNDLGLILVIGERAEDIRAWAEQIAPATTTRLVVATGYSAQPLVEPYVSQSGSVAGLLVGYRDAVTYGSMLLGSFATATPLPLPTDTPTPVPTEEPTDLPTQTPLPTDTPEPTEEATVEEATPQDSTEQTVDADPTTTRVNEPSTVVPTATVRATNTPEPTDTPTDLPTQTPLPTNTPTVTPTIELIRVAIITADGTINIRNGPGSTNPVMSAADPGAVFLVLGENEAGDWVNIQLPDGRSGWVADFLVEIVDLPADEFEEESDDSADAGTGNAVMRIQRDIRLGKNNSRIIRQQSETATPTVTGTPPTATPTATPTMTFTPSVTPTSTATPTATPDPRANFAPQTVAGGSGDSRLSAMTIGTIAAIVIILIGNLFYGLRHISRRRRESNQ